MDEELVQFQIPVLLVKKRTVHYVIPIAEMDITELDLFAGSLVQTVLLTQELIVSSQAHMEGVWDIQHYKDVWRKALLVVTNTELCIILSAEVVTMPLAAAFAPLYAHLDS